MYRRLSKLLETKKLNMTIIIRLLSKFVLILVFLMFSPSSKFHVIIYGSSVISNFLIPGLTGNKENETYPEFQYFETESSRSTITSVHKSLFHLD